MISAEILKDSVSQRNYRLTTFVLVYPRFIHSELMTHRTMSRNAASSRAIPVSKIIKDVRENPACPIFWGKNQKGMKAREALPFSVAEKAQKIWHESMLDAIHHAEQLSQLDVHKQITNRILEPYVHMTTLLSATDFNNFFKLRAHKDAQPEIQALAYTMLSKYRKSVPQKVADGDWHIPFGEQMAPNLTIEQQLAVATARAARVSYKNFNGEINVEDDLKLHDILKVEGHWSAFEHCAMTCRDVTSSNFSGWEQYRKKFNGESGLIFDVSKIEIPDSIGSYQLEK